MLVASSTSCSIKIPNFKGIYAVLSQIWKCRKSRVFGANFLGKKFGWCYIARFLQLCFPDKMSNYQYVWLGKPLATNMHVQTEFCRYLFIICCVLFVDKILLSFLFCLMCVIIYQFFMLSCHQINLQLLLFIFRSYLNFSGGCFYEMHNWFLKDDILGQTCLLVCDHYIHKSKSIAYL